MAPFLIAFICLCIATAVLASRYLAPPVFGCAMQGRRRAGRRRARQLARDAPGAGRRDARLCAERARPSMWSRGSRLRAAGGLFSGAASGGGAARRWRSWSPRARAGDAGNQRLDDFRQCARRSKRRKAVSAAARRRLATATADYNRALRRFPECLFAGRLRLTPATTTISLSTTVARGRRWSERCAPRPGRVTNRRLFGPC